MPIHELNINRVLHDTDKKTLTLEASATGLPAPLPPITAAAEENGNLRWTPISYRMVLSVDKETTSPCTVDYVDTGGNWVQIIWDGTKWTTPVVKKSVEG